MISILDTNIIRRPRGKEAEAYEKLEDVLDGSLVITPTVLQETMSGLENHPSQKEVVEERLDRIEVRDDLVVSKEAMRNTRTCLGEMRKEIWSGKITSYCGLNNYREIYKERLPGENDIEILEESRQVKLEIPEEEICLTSEDNHFKDYRSPIRNHLEIGVFSPSDILYNENMWRKLELGNYERGA